MFSLSFAAGRDIVGRKVGHSARLASSVGAAALSSSSVRWMRSLISATSAISAATSLLFPAWPRRCPWRPRCGAAAAPAGRLRGAALASSARSSLRQRRDPAPPRPPSKAAGSSRIGPMSCIGHPLGGAFTAKSPVHASARQRSREAGRQFPAVSAAAPVPALGCSSVAPPPAQLTLGALLLDQLGDPDRDLVEEIHREGEADMLNTSGGVTTAAKIEDADDRIAAIRGQPRRRDDPDPARSVRAPAAGSRCRKRR